MLPPAGLHKVAIRGLVMTDKQPLITMANIESKILLIRGQKVMLDADLAELYEVETRRLNEQVSRNKERFPEDFMFQLTAEEFANLKSQFATSSWGGRRKLPYVFTEHGALMLGNVLKSERAVEVSIMIVRTFVHLRELVSSNNELSKKLDKLERKFSGHDRAISELINPSANSCHPLCQIRNAPLVLLSGKRNEACRA